MKITKKFFSVMVLLAMVLLWLPATAAATEAEYVYVSVSYDSQYIADKNGAPIAYVPVPLAEVAAIDLSAYELGDYWYDADGDGNYEITALQLVIYAHETLYGGSWSDVTFTGSPGSSYFQGGIFGFDENLNYYLNGEYPLASEGWGATSDQIVLKAGDYLDIGSFSSWSFFGDSNYGFHFFADSDGAFTHHYRVNAGEELPVKLVRSYSGMGSGAIVFEEPGYTIFYGTSLYDAAGTVETDDTGCAGITFPAGGTWYLWCDGGYGCEYPDDIVSTPAYAEVTVTEVTPPSVTQVKKWNITLEDALNVNFYLDIHASIESSANVEITVADTTVTYAPEDLEKTQDGLYAVSVKLAAAQMTEEIHVAVKNGDATEISESYTIRQYADAVLADETLSQYHCLVKEMLHYGATAQTYFGYRPDALADQGITGTGAVKIPADGNRELTVSGNLEDITFYGATLLFRDRIAVRFYFRGDVTAASFAVNGTSCLSGSKNGMHYVEITDILPQDLDREINLTITDGAKNEMQISYSPMAYILRMNEKGSQSLGALLQALYNYHSAAKDVAALG